MLSYFKTFFWNTQDSADFVGLTYSLFVLFVFWSPYNIPKNETISLFRNCINISCNCPICWVLRKVTEAEYQSSCICI